MGPKGYSATIRHPVDHFVDVDLADALEIASDLEIYAYEAYDLQCARVHRSPILTLDGGLVRAAEKLDLGVLEVSE